VRGEVRGEKLRKPLRIELQPHGRGAPARKRTCARVRGNMSTAQDSPKRRKQKARRTKQLNEWREKKATSKTAEKSEKKPAK
jgi:hypothetical protein